MLLSQQLIVLLLITFTHGDDCPIFFNPPELVVEYGASASVNCSTSITVEVIGWNISEGAVQVSEDLVSWSVNELWNWELEQTCYISSNKTQCSQNLMVTLYKTPDSVSLSTVDHTGSMIEGEHYKLQCDIQDVAPVKSLRVKWFKGETLLNLTTFNDTTKTPVNESATLLITANKADDGVQYRCEAELELGPDGPQPPPTVTSKPLYISISSQCPVQLNPPRLVARYDSPVSVNCSAAVAHEGMGWEASEESVPMNDFSLITWNVQNLRQWDIQPMCFIIYNGDQCTSPLPITIYKTPDSVSLSTVDHTGSMIEGEHYKLQCDIQDVAPVKSLRVKWFKGETQVNLTTFSDTTRFPVNESATLLITANKADDGVQYRCEAELELGPDGPQSPPTVTSEPLNISISSQCPVQLNPPRLVARYDSPVSVNCSAAVAHEGMGWEASEGSVPMTEDSLITWNVQNLRQWDIQPMCFINFNGEQCTSPLPTTIYKTPDSVSISTADDIVMDGNLYKLQCDIQDVAPVKSLRVKWFKGETLLNLTTFNDTTKTPVNESATLLITANKADDGVQYRCEAELELGPDGPQRPPTVTSEPLSITVQYKPEIKICKDWSPAIWSSLGSYPSSSSVVGNPRPKISWSHGSSSVSVSKQLDKHDSGHYKITASNKHGNSSCVIRITLEYPPEINCHDNYQIKEKTLFKPPCLFDGSPKPHVFLYKDEKAIQLPYYPTWNDSGWYHLTASNKYRTVHHNFTINILYAPMFDTNQATFFVVEDSDISLECNSTGNPEPEMWWSFNNKNISAERHHRQITLNIQKATFTSAGVYKCSATNEFGLQEKNFIVEIKGNFPINITIVVALIAFTLLALIILFLYGWKKRKSSGHYQIQSEKQYEMCLLSNGGPK
ncbi:intercellular adhesion molecule 5 isoform X6 [Xyrauchen texanus]|uniref:intercellular adhesion molecule 5 isoform X6 n=1 Tax=Xyrauchen texanus TaxID=154827 RepID=UPI002242773E|nr:intercellular adhesion molecule 5 isoform X6 [Xyrauchen texanus]